jgi:Fic family protein
MNTFRLLARKPETIPAVAAWYLADIAESRGRQQLFSRQIPQRLKALREHAIVESAVSSNRIEGVEVERSRIAAVVLGAARLRDRNEEELRGYREALSLIHQQGSALPISDDTIRHLHRLTRGAIWDAGLYKEKESDIIERYPDGRSRVRFKTVPASDTPAAMHELLESWSSCIRESWTHPLVALAAFNLDFLCIHPFRDGNGRVSRLLLLLQCYHLGYEVGRLISLERLIEQDKERYYETLEGSSERWHEAAHDPWIYTTFLLYILRTAYRELEERIGRQETPRGSKTGMIEEAVGEFPGEFTIRDVERACPAVGRELIRRVLRRLAVKGVLECHGRGPAARWKRKGTVS